MNRPGDMWRVAYPEDTGPRHAPLDWPLPRHAETEAQTMADKVPDLVYVNLYGEEVSADDPAAQTQFAPDELKALRKGGFFPKRGSDAVVDAAAEEAAGTPVLNSGVGTAEADAEDEGAKKSTRRTAKE